jgi:MFS family permease
MAIIGVAFALGFVVGPAFGGILSLIDLTKIYPESVKYGINPFSMPAAFAFFLSIFNTVWISTKFKESLPPEKRGLVTTERSANIFKLFKPLPYPGVNLVNLGYFLFLAAFSGMEFTLTFLAAERLNYTSMQNAYIFIYIGFIIAFVQGGIVRRKAASFGEKRMAILGIVSLIPGLLLIAAAYSSPMLYAGLFFLAVGSSMIMPCLTTLITFYTPADEQGRSVGIFRSMGALARVVGPIFAAVAYYKYGAWSPYVFGSAFLLIPIYLLSKLPKVNHSL